jgi:hypothetical protein
LLPVTALEQFLLEALEPAFGRADDVEGSLGAQVIEVV